MTERDKELAMQAGFNPFDTECYEGLDVLIDLIRADTMEAATRAANQSWMLLAKAMIAAEREACAKVCEEMAYVDPQPHHYANAIRTVRAGGNT